MRSSILKGGLKHARESAAIQSEPRDKKLARIYTASSVDPKKEAVNAWLVGLLPVLSNCTSKRWALVLDTPALRTVRSLESAGKGITVGTIVVCNPDAASCALMAASCPELHIVRATSHALLSRLRNQEDPAYLIETTHFPGNFAFVWLDYCGTFLSTAGRERQRDLEALLSNNGRLLHPAGCILALTVAQRGSPQMYRSELIDSVVLFVEELAALLKLKREIAVAGVAAYLPLNGNDEMLTVAIEVSGRQPQHDVTHSAAAVHLNPQLSSDHCSCDGLTVTRGWQLGAFRIGEDTRCEPRPLYRALRDVASYFAALLPNFIADGKLPPLSALVLDNKLLLVSKALVNRCRTSITIRAIIPDPLDAALARRIITTNRNREASFGACSVECTALGKLLHEMKASKDIIPQAHNAVWLSYMGSKPFTAARLRCCADWRDLNDVLELGILTRNGVLGIMVGFASTCEIWEGAAVDWLVCGVVRAGRRYGYVFSVARVITFVCTHNWLHVSFRASANIGQSESVLNNVGTADQFVENEGLRKAFVTRPAGWICSVGWNLDRPKRPPLDRTSRLNANKDIVSHINTANNNALFFRAVPLVCSAACEARSRVASSTVVLFEPGFHTVFGSLRNQVMEGNLAAALPNESAIGANDVLAHELTRRCVKYISAAFSSSTAPDFLNNVNCVILLDDCGVSSWKKRWAPLIHHFLRVDRGTKKKSTLVAAFEAPNAKFCASELVNLVKQSGREASVGEQLMVRNRGRRLFVTLLTITSMLDADEEQRAATNISARA